MMMMMVMMKKPVRGDRGKARRMTERIKEHVAIYLPLL